MKLLSILLTSCLAAMLCGCSSLPKAFANRVGCTADGKRAVVSSMYGPIGVASYVDADDAAALCARPQAAAAAPALR